MPNPVYGYADHGPPDDCQVHHRIGLSDPAAVLASDNIQSEMKAGFNAPISTVGLEHLLSIHLSGGAGAEQVFGFDFLGRLAGAVHTTGQPSRLLREGKGNARGGGIKGNEAPRFDPTAVAFTSLNDGRLVPRGKRRATDADRAVARCRRHRIDCL